MKKFTLVVVVVMALATFASGQNKTKQTTPVVSSEQQVMNAVRQLHRAIMDADTKTIQRLEAEDFKFIRIDGSEEAKEFDVNNSYPKAYRPESGTPEEMSVRIYGDTAVVTGRLTNYIRKDDRVVYKFTDVWVKRNNQWQVVASHYSLMKP